MTDDWIKHPLHPTRVKFEGSLLTIEQQVGRRLRIGPILSTVTMAWLMRSTSWDADDDSKLSWSVAFTVMGDWQAAERGMLQLVCGGDGRPGLRRGRKPGRIKQDLAVGWRGSRSSEPWLDLETTGVIPLVLHYQPMAEVHPALWSEVEAMASAALMVLPGRSAYQLARVLNLLEEPEGLCVYCGSAQELTFDHAIPLEQGGNPWGDNLVPACLSCNTHKGAIPLEAWLESLKSVHDRAAIDAALQTNDTPRALPRG